MELIGDLRTIHLAGDQDAPTVVLFHGYGADAADLAGLADALRTPQGASWYFPEGFLSIGGMGRAWWPVDQAAVELAMRTGTHRDLRGAPPPGYAEALSRAGRFLDALAVPVRSLILGGFSQGAMLAARLCLSLPENPAALLLFSGNPIDLPTLARLAPARTGLRFFASHGRFDPVLSFAYGKEQYDCFTQSGMIGTFYEFLGGHEIPPGAMRGAEQVLG